MTNNVDDAVYAGLTEIFHTIFDDHISPTPGLTADQVPGWDSNKMVMIILAAEQHFGIKLRSREVDHLANVGDLAKVIEGKISK